jgi:hypothetical protein
MMKLGRRPETNRSVWALKIWFAGAAHSSPPPCGGGTPGESKGKYDFYKVLTKFPGEEAFRPLVKK